MICMTGENKNKKSDFQTFLKRFGTSRILIKMNTNSLPVNILKKKGGEANGKHGIPEHSKLSIG